MAMQIIHPRGTGKREMLMEWLFKITKLLTTSFCLQRWKHCSNFLGEISIIISFIMNGVLTIVLRRLRFHIQRIIESH